MVRGVNRMHIFLDNDDKVRFLQTLARMKSEEEYTLYGYCIMDNHAHLLIKEEKDSISRTMKRIGVSYSYYFNKKYDRVGHLFQDRFRSERIESENYILSCLRYIHNNPVKALITKEPSDYIWSSYNIYINKAENKEEIISPEFALSIFSENKSKAIEKFKKFSAIDCKEIFIDIDEEEEDIEKIQREKIKEILKGYNLKLEDLPKLKDRNTRTEIIREIGDNISISTREMANLIGLSKSTIARILK